MWETGKAKILWNWFHRIFFTSGIDAYACYRKKVCSIMFDKYLRF